MNVNKLNEKKKKFKIALDEIMSLVSFLLNILSAYFQLSNECSNNSTKTGKKFYFF